MRYDLGRKARLLLPVLFGLLLNTADAQTLSFEAKTSPSVDFIFNSVQDYENGLVQMSAITLNINVTGTNWDLYVGAETTNPGLWNVTSTYSGTGQIPTIDLVELRFRNVSNTSQVNGFFNLTDISTPTYIIGSAAAPDPSVSCPGTGTNQPGSYLSDPSCYEFDVDIRINPDFSYQAGLYTLTIKYVIVEDL